MSAARIYELYSLFAEGEYQSPGAPPAGLIWSECFRAIVAASSDQESLADLRLTAWQVQAACLNRSGKRGEAIEALKEGIATHPRRLYVLGLRVDLATYLRAQHEFDGALAQFSDARELIADLKAEGETSQYLLTQEATNLMELGALRAALGMTADARADFEKVEVLSKTLGDYDGPFVWGGNLVYRLNLANSRQKEGEVEQIRQAYESHPWRQKLPGETRKQIEMRLAISLSMEAFRGLKPAASGEAELRSLIDSGMKFEEDLRARIFLGQSLLDREALIESREVLDSANARLAAKPGMELPRLHLLGLHALLQRKEGATSEAKRALLDEQLIPAINRFLERGHRSPIEKAGISLLLYDWARAALGELIELELSLDEDGRGLERIFDWLVKLQMAGSFTREQGIAQPTLETVRRELLVTGRGLLVYVPGRVQSYALAASLSDLKLFRLQPAWRLDLRAHELEEEIQSVIMLRSGASDQRLELQLQASSTSFMPPELLQHISTWKAIQVVGLDDFGYVPLEALNGPSGQPLGQSHAICIQPSLPVGVWLAQRASHLQAEFQPPLFVLGQGDPRVGGRSHLVGLEFEMNKLAPPGVSSSGADSQLFSSSNLVDLPKQLSSASIAIFLLHGLFDAQRARPAGLLIRPEQADGAWFSDTIEKLTCPPFALLAACGGDRAQDRRGDDGQGHLRSAFFRGGAASVATSTVALDSLATQEFISLVNEGIANGDSISDAFHKARQRAGPEQFLTHPIHAYLLHAYGAADLRPFSLIDPNIILDAKGETANNPWAYLIVLLSIAGFVFAFRFRPRSRQTATQTPSSQDRQTGA